MNIMGQTLVCNIVAVYACMYILYGVLWLEYYCSRDQPRYATEGNNHIVISSNLLCMVC